MRREQTKLQKISQTVAAHMKGKKLKLALQTSLVQTSILANIFVVLANSVIFLSNDLVWFYGFLATDMVWFLDFWLMSFFISG
jgi:hypothetical protein